MLVSAYAEPEDILLHMTTPTTSDFQHMTRVARLYSIMKNDTTIHNVGDIVINVDHIYANYYAAHRGYIIFRDAPDDDINEIVKEPELIFVASIYIALCLWYPHNIDTLFRALVTALYELSKVTPPSAETIGSSVRHIMETLGGRVVRAPLFDMEDNKWHSANHNRLVGWFLGFRYASFLKPRYLAEAFSMIACDSERSNRKDNSTRLDTLGYWADVDRCIRITAQIIVTHFSHICGTRDETQIGYLHMMHVSRFIYHIVGLDSNQSSSTPSTPRDCATSHHRSTTTDSSSSSSSSSSLCGPVRTMTYNQCNHVLYVCTDVLSSNTVGESAVSCCVYRAHNTKRNQQRYTIKRYIVGDDQLGVSLATFVREVSILLSLSKYSDFICVPLSFGFDKHHAYIYMSPHGTSISEYVFRNRQHFNSHAMESLFHDMAAALLVCEHYNIVHNDVKPDNFIVEDGRAKLIDFGLAMCHFSYMHVTTDCVQTVLYRAPELLLGDDIHDESIDIWAFGCTMYELCTGRRLFAMKPRDQQRFRIELDGLGGITSTGRKMQLAVILSRLKRNGLYDKKEREYLASLPLWVEFVGGAAAAAAGDSNNIEDKIRMYEKYSPIDWSNISPTTTRSVVAAIEACLKLLPSLRPSAYSLTHRLTRRDSLF